MNWRVFSPIWLIVKKPMEKIMLNSPVFNTFKITVLAVLLLFASHVLPAIIVVNNDQDLMQLDGNCDLRDALNSASINISIDGCVAGEAGVQDVVIVQVAGPIQLAGTLPVFGSVVLGTNFGADPVEILAAPGERIMRVRPISENDNNFAIGNFKLIGGVADGETNGGAIYFSGSEAPLGFIEINNVYFENNHADVGGALYFDETLAAGIRIFSNVFDSNTADSLAGAMGGYRMSGAGEAMLEVHRNVFDANHSDGAVGAVFIRNSGSADIILNDNVFTNNSAVDSTGAMSLGRVVGNQNFYVNRNLFMFNTAGGNTGGLEVSFGAIVYVRDSLFAFNRATRGGAVTSVFDDSLLRLSYSTLVHNQASLSGDNIHIFSNGRLIPSANVVAYPANGDNCSGALGTTPPSGTRPNYTDDDSCELLTGLPNTQIVDPRLSGFASDSMRFPGFAPMVDSPIIDVYDNCAERDLLGQMRPIDGDGDGAAFCDAGAIEAAENEDAIWYDSFGL